MSEAYHLRCPNCHKELFQDNPKICPYCGNKILISKEESFKLELEKTEKLEEAGRYGEAAERYEELEMWDKVRECRSKANANSPASDKAEYGTVRAINMQCPYCGAVQSIALKSDEVMCEQCGRDYAIPKNVLELL